MSAPLRFRWTPGRFGGASASSGFVKLFVHYDVASPRDGQPPYVVCINGHQLKRRFSEPLTAQKYVEQVARRWLADALAAFDAPATDAQEGE